MFEGFYSFFSSVLNWFYTLVPSYGGAIIMLTLAVMAVITPLTLKSTRSMLQMQRLQPELKRIQQQYKDDRERMNQELMAFYREHDLNPLSGCIPLLAQSPVFIILYGVLRGLTVRQGGTGSGTGHFVATTATAANPDAPGFTPWILTDQVFAPLHLKPGQALYDSLRNVNRMNFMGMDLSISPAQALKMGFVVAIPFLLLILAMAVAQWIQNRQIQGRNTGAPQASGQQQALMKILPFMLPVISFSFPAGLGLYYFTQSLCRIGTQAYITKRFYRGDDAPGAVTRARDSASPETLAKDASADKPGPRERAEKAVPPKRGSKPSAGANGSGSAPAKRPGTSARSQAAQKKADGGATGSRRKSGAPRTPRTSDGNDRGRGRSEPPS